ncbi:MAG: LLM class flavin-dependent oxidoreductase [Halieaceae bacterium]|jgi:probable F420-dependent oxidoreductase|nr:LLM class flavin-dependent oxidoreductase [Halieaceae bacterium]
MTESAPKTRIAMSLPAITGSVADTLALARRAEALGYDDLWLADAGGLDALTLAPLILEATRSCRLGVAVVPVYTRTPAVLASTLAVIEQAFPGRFVPGLGTSSHAIIEGWHGLSLDKPLTRIRETVQLLRGMLAGEKTAFSGETLHSHGYRQAPTPGVPLYLAALRPRMLETAAEIADGVILNLFPRSALPRIMEHIAIGAERAGKDPASVEVVCRHMVAVTDDLDAARAAFRAGFVGYYATPVYNKFLEWAGYPEAAAEIREGWAARDRERTAAALPDALIDEIGILGGPEQARETMRWYAQHGIHTNIVSCVMPDAAVQQGTTLAFGAEQFRF